MPAAPSPTPRQLETLRVVEQCIGLGLPPSYADLCLALGVTRQAVRDLLDALERRGLIRREPRIARGIWMTPRGRRLLCGGAR